MPSPVGAYLYYCQPVETNPKIVKVSGRDLAVEDAGPESGFPVLVHHGGSRHLFPGAVRDAQASGVRLISYDRPGQGGSTPHPGGSWPTSARSRMRGASREQPCGVPRREGLTPWRPPPFSPALSPQSACSHPWDPTVNLVWTSPREWAMSSASRSGPSSRHPVKHGRLPCKLSGVRATRLEPGVVDGPVGRSRGHGRRS
jgi:hypothetical protein